MSSRSVSSSTMKTKISRDNKRPTSRLQKQAPASLQLDSVVIGPQAWDNPCAAPIPLLSPLILTPSPFPETASEREDRGSAGCSSSSSEDKERRPPPPQPGGGWRHPALPMVVMEPVTLLPFFQAQCALVHNVQ